MLGHIVPKRFSTPFNHDLAEALVIYPFCSLLYIIQTQASSDPLFQSDWNRGHALNMAREI